MDPYMDPIYCKNHYDIVEEVMWIVSETQLDRIVA